MENRIAFIGGTGVYNLEIVEETTPVKVSTDYGEVTLHKGRTGHKTVFFMSRHGGEHKVPPHRVNYQANISALKVLGVQQVVATAAVGSLKEKYEPGSMVVLDQFIDFTKNRYYTFFSGGGKPVVHTDFTYPYCPYLRRHIINEGNRLNLKMADGGTYVCTEGPRFETPAEINMFEKMGGDLVGMTNVPEVLLAREAGLCYATVALVTNYAAGISPHILTHEEVVEVMESTREDVNLLFKGLVQNAFPEQGCGCGDFGKYFEMEEGEIIEEKE